MIEPESAADLLGDALHIDRRARDRHPLKEKIRRRDAETIPGAISSRIALQLGTATTLIPCILRPDNRS